MPDRQKLLSIDYYIVLLERRYFACKLIGDYYITYKRFHKSLPDILLGRVGLVAQRPIVIKLSRGRSVCRCVGPFVRPYVGLSSALWKNGGSDPDAVWYHRSDKSIDEAGSGV